MFFKKSLGTLIENIHEALIIIDDVGNLAVINHMAEELLGISSKDSIGRYVEEVIPGTELIRILNTGSEQLSQYMKINDKEIVTSRIAIKEDEKVIGAMAIFNDITNEKSMQSQLNANKGYLDSLLTITNALNEWTVSVDDSGRVTSISEPYKEFLGCDNPIGKKVEEIIENTRMNNVLKTGIAEIGDIQEIKSNKMIAMRVPLKKDGRIVGAVAKVVFKDISDFQMLSSKVNNLEKEIEFYKSRICESKTAKYSVENIIGTSEKIMAVKDLIKKAANTNSNVLINGESGTGKEMIAHAIHNSSKRCLAPFIKVNCAAIPPELLESELFGYEDGAFTGAKKGGKKGKFEIANGGSIFLDEIGDMPIGMQAKILRVIQERELESIGAVGVKAIDVRIIAATNKNLEEMVENGEFRQDLYYRLNVVKVISPALRDRREDIPLLANALRRKVAERLGIYVEGISKDAMECLYNYNWPGNVRELENVIERAINLLDSNIIIDTEHLSERLVNIKHKRHLEKHEYLKDLIERVEKEIIIDCLNKTNWNKNKTSQILGISRAGLYKKIEEYKLR